MNARPENDCGECSSTLHCWPERIGTGCGYIARRLKPFGNGDLIVREGDVFEAPLLVTSGCVAITQSLKDGDERIVAFRLRGELIGVESWLGPSNCFSAQAVGPATVCRLRWTPSGIAARPLAVVRSLLDKVSRQLGQATRIWPGLSADEKVRAFAEDFEARSPSGLPMTRAQIGRHLGIAEETVVRAFARRRKAKVEWSKAGDAL